MGIAKKAWDMRLKSHGMSPGYIFAAKSLGAAPFD
jgi:hypothetical protein